MLTKSVEWKRRKWDLSIQAGRFKIRRRGGQLFHGLSRGGLEMKMHKKILQEWQRKRALYFHEGGLHCGSSTSTVISLSTSEMGPAPNWVALCGLHYKSWVAQHEGRGRDRRKGTQINRERKQERRNELKEVKICQELDCVELISVLTTVRFQELKTGARLRAQRESAFHTESSMWISNRYNCEHR